MVALKVSEFDPAGALTGAEVVGLVRGNENLQTTTADIAALAIGDAANAEFIRDTVGTLLTDTGLVVLTVDDGANTVDVNVPAAAAADLNTGTDTTKAVTSDALAGSNFGKAVWVIPITDPAGSALTTGDGKAYFPIPAVLNGMNLVNAEMSLTTVSSSGIPTFQIANVTQAVDMLTTKLTVDANELHSKDATTAVVIDAANDDVATGDLLRFDCDVAGTGTKGVTIILTFQLP